MEHNFENDMYAINYYICSNCKLLKVYWKCTVSYFINFNSSEQTIYLGKDLQNEPKCSDIIMRSVLK